MKSVLDALPDILMPDATGEADATTVPLQWPDDDDLIRPDAEDELVRVAEAGALTRSSRAPLGKHLVWTFGPIHRALLFPLQLRFELSGDRIITCDPEIGWTHLGLERLFGQVSLDEGVHLARRLAPSNPVAPTLAYVLAVERLLGVAEMVPPFAQQVRVLCAELSRIGAHLRVIAPLLTGISDRRARGAIISATHTVSSLLNLVAEPDGELLIAHVGGLSRDLADGVLGAVERSLPDALGPVADAQRELFRDVSFTAPLRGRGALTNREAIAAGLTGPALRATGDDDDLRRGESIFAYRSLSPRVISAEGGDALARLTVRWEEIQASGGLCLRTVAALTGQAADAPPVDGQAAESTSGETTTEQMVDPRLSLLPSDPEKARYQLDLPRTAEGLLEPDAGRASGGVEGPSGELQVWIDHPGGSIPRRVRWKGPSFSLASALPKFLEGQRLDDVVPILRSLGIQPSELDR